jgi:CelD/BcsL family acetyltransferase involved in cellulose biosynthesis
MSVGGIVDTAIRHARRAPPPLRPGLTFDVVAQDSAMPLLPEWSALAVHAAGDNLFFRPDFAMPAMRHLNHDVAIAVVRQSDRRLAALAPFTRTRLGRIAPAARLWAHEYAPLGLPLVDEKAVEAGTAALLEGLAPPESGTSLIAADLPMESPVSKAMVAAALKQSRPVDVLDGHVRAMLLRPDPGAMDPRSALSAKRRKEIGRQLRRLQDVGEVTFTAAIDAAEVRERFEAFMQLEAAGWKGKRGTALISNEATAEFAREVVANRAEAGAARVDSIELGGHPIAMVVTLAAGATAYTWKIAYDEERARFSPGVQLMLELPKGLFSDPTLMRIDSCAAADHPMIDALWSGRLAVGTLVIGPPGGSALHRIGLAAARAEISARATLRRLRG